MRTIKAFIAVALSALIPAESVQALPSGAYGASSAFQISLPSSLGFVSDMYATKASAQTPDVILIQDLHVNRSVQFAISGILKRLKEQGMMPDHIAVEGGTGPIDITAMQRTPDPSIRKEAADYLVRQGEMPAAMHFAVTEGAGGMPTNAPVVGLFGIETDEYYKANLEMFRRSYKERTQLRDELAKIQAVLPKLKKDASVAANAEILNQDLAAVSQLINNEVTPEALPAILKRASQAVEHLKLVLPQLTSPRQVVSRGPSAVDSPLTPAGNDGLVQALSASVNFYALALLRNDELFKNTLAVRQLGRQKTSIVITGGFHTQSLAESCKRHGLSYVVITPKVRRVTKVDEKLYTERLLGHHLTVDQVEQGLDWASAMLAPAYDGSTQRLWFPSLKDVRFMHPARFGKRLIFRGFGALLVSAVTFLSPNKSPAQDSVATSVRSQKLELPLESTAKLGAVAAGVLATGAWTGRDFIPVLIGIGLAALFLTYFSFRVRQDIRMQNEQISADKGPQSTRRYLSKSFFVLLGAAFTGSLFSAWKRDSGSMSGQVAPLKEYQNRSLMLTQEIRLADFTPSVADNRNPLPFDEWTTALPFDPHNEDLIEVILAAPEDDSVFKDMLVKINSTAGEGAARTSSILQNLLTRDNGAWQSIQSVAVGTGIEMQTSVSERGELNEYIVAGTRYLQLTISTERLRAWNVGKGAPSNLEISVTPQSKKEDLVKIHGLVRTYRAARNDSGTSASIRYPRRDLFARVMKPFAAPAVLALVAFALATSHPAAADVVRTLVPTLTGPVKHSVGFGSPAEFISMGSFRVLGLALVAILIAAYRILSRPYLWSPMSSGNWVSPDRANLAPIWHYDGAPPEQLEAMMHLLTQSRVSRPASWSAESLAPYEPRPSIETPDFMVDAVAGKKPFKLELRINKLPSQTRKIRVYSADAELPDYIIPVFKDSADESLRASLVAVIGKSPYYGLKLDPNQLDGIKESVFWIDVRMLAPRANLGGPNPLAHAWSDQAPRGYEEHNLENQVDESYLLNPARRILSRAGTSNLEMSDGPEGGDAVVSQPSSEVVVLESIVKVRQPSHEHLRIGKKESPTDESSKKELPPILVYSQDADRPERVVPVFNGHPIIELRAGFQDDANDAKSAREYSLAEPKDIAWQSAIRHAEYWIDVRLLPAILAARQRDARSLSEKDQAKIALQRTELAVDLAKSALLMAISSKDASQMKLAETQLLQAVADHQAAEFVTVTNMVSGILGGPQNPRNVADMWLDDQNAPAEFAGARTPDAKDSQEAKRSRNPLGYILGLTASNGGGMSGGGLTPTQRLHAAAEMRALRGIPEYVINIARRKAGGPRLFNLIQLTKEDLRRAGIDDYWIGQIQQELSYFRLSLRSSHEPSNGKNIAHIWPGQSGYATRTFETRHDEAFVLNPASTILGRAGTSRITEGDGGDGPVGDGEPVIRLKIMSFLDTALAKLKNFFSSLGPVVDRVDYYLKWAGFLEEAEFAIAPTSEVDDADGLPNDPNAALRGVEFYVRNRIEAAHPTQQDIYWDTYAALQELKPDLADMLADVKLRLLVDGNDLLKSRRAVDEVVKAIPDLARRQAAKRVFVLAIDGLDGLDVINKEEIKAAEQSAAKPVAISIPTEPNKESPLMSIPFDLAQAKGRRPRDVYFHGANLGPMGVRAVYRSNAAFPADVVPVVAGTAYPTVRGSLLQVLNKKGAVKLRQYTIRPTQDARKKEIARNADDWVDVEFLPEDMRNLETADPIKLEPHAETSSPSAISMEEFKALREQFDASVGRPYGPENTVKAATAVAPLTAATWILSGLDFSVRTLQQIRVALMPLRTQVFERYSFSGILGLVALTGLFAVGLSAALIAQPHALLAFFGYSLLVIGIVEVLSAAALSRAIPEPSKHIEDIGKFPLIILGAAAAGLLMGSHGIQHLVTSIVDYLNSISAAHHDQQVLIGQLHAALAAMHPKIGAIADNLFTIPDQYKAMLGMAVIPNLRKKLKELNPTAGAA